MATPPRLKLLLLFKILVFSMVSFLFYWIFLSNGERREVFETETLQDDRFIGCPPFNFTWDSPAVMKALGNRTKQKYECKRENGLTLFEKGKIRLNTEWPNYENYTCEASCAIPKNPYNYTLGPKCIVGKNCDKFGCDFVLVNCWKNGEHVHIDVHIQIVENSRDRKKQFGKLYKASPSKEQAHRSGLYRPDVVILVIDSAGRFVAKRELQETYKFMMDELKAVDFTQYTQSAFNSRYNALAMFWGEIGATIDRTEYGGTILKENSACRTYYDDRPNVQFEYEDAGYRTWFGGDHILDLYAYSYCWGTKNPLANHVFRTYSLLSFIKKGDIETQDPFNRNHLHYNDPKLLRQHIRNKTRCGEQWIAALDYLGKFQEAYEGIPKMSIAWFNAGHDDERPLGDSFDPIFAQFLRERKLEDSFVILMGDHGQRFGPVIELSGQGMFERSNVLMLFSVPKKLRNTPIETMLRENQDKLFTPHDVHATLIDIVRHQPAAAFQDTSFMKINGTMGNSWLRELDPELPRDCRHLPIPSELCPCNYGKEEMISRNNPVWQMLEKELIIENFNQILSENEELNALCEKAKLKNVTSVMKKQNSLKQMQFKVEFFTTRNGQFVAQFKLDNRGNLVLYPKEFQRINRYARTADCLIEKLDLRSMCYCKVQPNEAPKKSQ